MISFRHHVVSLVAVFLALAVGVALGGGPLADVDDTATSAGQTPSVPSDPTGDDPTGDDPTGDDTTEDGAAGASSEEYAERFAAAAGTRLYADGLATAPVAVVAMPDADRDVLKSLAGQIQAAGGRVTGRYGVQEPLLDPGERSLVDTLGSQLATQLGVDATAPTYERLGQLLGLAIATTGPSAVPPTQPGLAARDSIAGASLVTRPGVDVANAPLVLVVLGPEDEVDPAVAEIQSALVAGLTTTAAGVVVLGDEASAVDGTLQQLRTQTVTGVLATVDGGTSELAQVSTVLALIGAVAGRSGAYGASSADGGVPLS